MILDVTYEGNGVFKVWPPPDEKTAKEIILWIKSQDAGNYQDRAQLPLLESGPYGFCPDEEL